MKALVIGLDGGTYRILDPLMAAGHMPNLRKAVSGGARGNLLSTVPPVTALAWPSFLTGKNPGKHGLFGWQERLNADFARPWVNSRKIHGPKLWQLANEQGLRTCLMNVPVTYPPEPLNGTMVSGMLTPGLEARFTYPPELQEALLASVPGYKIDVDVQHTEHDTRDPDGVRRFLREVRSTTRARGEAAQWLLERHPPDLAVVVFEMPDRLQHILWRYIEPASSAHHPPEPGSPPREELLTCYRVLDQEVGRLVNLLPRDTYLVLLSDHGFGPLDTLVHLNKWLVEQGWLMYDRYRADRRQLVRRIARLAAKWLPSSLKEKGRRALPQWNTLDWDQTWAYAGLPSENGVFLNVRRREPAGVVYEADYSTLRDEIIEALRCWQDPRTGEPIMRAVYQREEIYRGPFVADAPDIVFELREGYKVSHLPSRGDLLTDVSSQPHGFHEREGVFAMSGPGIRSDVELTECSIEDVVPTLLYALGLSLPDDLDGCVLLEAFAPTWRSRYPLRSHTAPEAQDRARGRSAYSDEEEEAIAEHLRNLGYLE